MSRPDWPDGWGKDWIESEMIQLILKVVVATALVMILAISILVGITLFVKSLVIIIGVTEEIHLIGHGFAFVLILGIFLFYIGLLPIPIGYDRGKVKWVMWCGTGMHAHVVYWHSGDDGDTDLPGFQSIHPDEVNR